MTDAEGSRASGSARERQRLWLRSRAERDATAVDVRIGVAASFTAEPLESQLGTVLVEAGYAHPEIAFAPYNQLHQVCLDPASFFGEPLDHLVLLWRIEDVFERQLDDLLRGEPDAEAAILAGVAELAALVVAADATSAGTIIVSTPPHPAGWMIDLRDAATSLRVGRVHREALAIWLDKLARAPEIEMVDLDALQRYAGESSVFAPEKWAMYRQPYQSDFWFLVGSEIGRIAARSLEPAPKCLVLDCDNTLWGGTVGEDGIGGLELGDAFPGRAFQAFQRQLKIIQSRGVMLAIVSKNNEFEVVEVFERHEGMVLTLGDITTRRINWETKSENIASIAAELNIGVDSIVFVDDSPFEVEEASSALPGLRCLCVPDELAELPGLLASSGWFRHMRTSVEDRQRTAMMQSESRRQGASETMDHEQFLRSLQLTVTFSRASDEHVNRVAQLTNKTNQFNLTTIRRSEKEIRTLIESATNEVYVIRVADRFGEYGLVGVVVIDVESDRWAIDTFLMSCRVLGRGVETALLSAVAELAHQAGVRHLVGRYAPTPKNAQVADFYGSHGFEAGTDPGTFTLDLGRGRPEKPGHIDVVR